MRRGREITERRRRATEQRNNRARIFQGRAIDRQTTEAVSVLAKLDGNGKIFIRYCVISADLGEGLAYQVLYLLAKLDGNGKILIQLCQHQVLIYAMDRTITKVSLVR